MSALTCPGCQATTEPAARIGTVAICGACGASLVVQQDGTIRRAMASDIEVLAPGERTTLTKARSQIVRPKA